MSDQTPQDPSAEYLAEFKADNAQDDARAREFIATMSDAQRQQLLVTQLAARFAAERNDKMVEAFKGGQGLSDREAAVYFLANLPASTNLNTRKRVVTDCLQVLRDLQLGLS